MSEKEDDAALPETKTYKEYKTIRVSPDTYEVLDRIVRRLSQRNYEVQPQGAQASRVSRGGTVHLALQRLERELDREDGLPVSAIEDDIG